MYANIIGIPAAGLVFLAVNHYLSPVVGDRLAVGILAGCLGLCAYFAMRRVDIYLEQKKDNPPTFVVPKTLPNAFGGIKECLSESSYGPFFWGIKNVDAEAGKLVAVLQFSELMGTGFIIPPIQAQRLMMLTVLVESVPEADQKTAAAGETAATNVTMTWRIDSPYNRLTVNRIMDETTVGIKEALGLPSSDKPKPRSPFLPPTWLIVVTVLAALFCNQRAEEYAALKAKQEADLKAKQEQLAAERAKREEAESKWRQFQEEQRRKADEVWKRQNQSVPPAYSPYSLSPPSVPSYQPYYNPFTPTQTPQPTPSPAPVPDDTSNSTPWRATHHE